MKFKKYLLTLFCLFAGLTSFAQNDSSFFNRTVNSLSSYSASHPVEKVYLHLNKQYYMPGDTIWFKAYTVVGSFHQLSLLSGVLYCELINNKDSVISHHNLKLMEGITWGDFSLARSLKPGKYHVRAYTNWMRNAGPEYFYDQEIQLGGGSRAGEKTLEAALNPLNKVQAGKMPRPDVQFFPEGGELVNGVRSKVAVKAVNAAGVGQDITGTIVDNNGEKVADFSTRHLGMGTFALLPQTGKSYTAKISCADSSEFTVNLPAAQQEGYTITINNSGADSIYLKVAANDKLFNEKQNTMFYLLAQAGGKVYYTAQAKLISPVFTTQIAKKRFPSGIVQFTLFSQNGEPLSERIIFIQNDDNIKIEVSSPSAVYLARQKVKIDLATKSPNAKLVQGSFSASVINESRIPVNEETESSILNNLLLTSDLKGYVEQPNYYFNNVNDQTRANLDVLMLTQGYRKFEWKRVLDTLQLPVQYNPENSLEVAGSLKTPGGKPLPLGKVTLAATRENLLLDTVTDAAGNFKFTNVILSDTANVILRARKQRNGSNVAIYVKQPDYPSVIRSRIKPDTASQLTDVMLRNIADYQQKVKQDSIKSSRNLKEVVIKEKPTFKPDVYNSYGTALEFSVDMKKMNKFVTLKDGLLALVPGISYIDGKIKYEFHGIKLMIDGLDREIDVLDLYTPQEVDNIRIIDPTFRNPATLMINTKSYEGTDTTTTMLKTVVIKDKKTEKADMSNRYGTDHPRTISGSNLAKISNNLKMSLMQAVPGTLLVEGKLVTTFSTVSFVPKHTPLYIIVNDMQTTQDELDNYSPDEIEFVKVLEGGAYKSLYGIMGEKGATVGGAGKDDGVPILYVITKQFAGTDTAKTINLKTVNIKDTKTPKKPELTNSSNLNGPGNADQVIMGSDLYNCVNLSDCLVSKIFGVTFKNGVPYSTREQAKLSARPAMTVIIDGVVTAGGSDEMDNLNPSDVYSIEVLRSGAYLAVYGSQAPGGALIITTKRGSSANYVTSVVPAGLITYRFNGYYKSRTFYSPKYTGPRTEAQAMDLRSTIYWNPNIITDKDGKASLEFFNADTKGTYRIVIEGIDDNGNLGRQVYKYKVE